MTNRTLKNEIKLYLSRGINKETIATLLGIEEDEIELLVKE